MKSAQTDIPPAHADIFRTIAAIPPGRVAGYGEIAARAGLPGRARLVGKLLGETPPGADLPWYRVLRSDGRIALPPGSRGFREQVRRLAAEGVLAHNGRVDMTRYGWERNLDDLLWAPPVAAPSVRKRSRPTR